MKIKVTYEKVFELNDIYDETLFEEFQMEKVSEETFTDGIIETLTNCPWEILNNLTFETIKDEN